MENIKIRESQRQLKLKSNEIALFKDAFVIVPYQVSGFIDYTNNGYVNSAVDPNDFETFKRIWTGNDACIISWKNSIYYTKNENEEIQTNYQLGSFFVGTLETNDFSNDISKDTSFTDYTTQQQINTITFKVDKTFRITDYYNFMFYKIPELSGSTLYRIENIEKDYSGLELLNYIITFKTINQELANTGRARQQNIMPNPPGQGYLECIVKDKNWPDEIGEEAFKKLIPMKDYIPFYDRYITSQFIKVYHNPIQKVVVKAIGNGIINSFSMFGRPVKRQDDFTKFRSPRPLFPHTFRTPQTPTLYRVQENNSNYYFGNFSPTLEYFKDLMSFIKDSLTPVNKWNYQGWLKYNYGDLQKSNPKTNGHFKYDLYGFLEVDPSKDTNIVPWEVDVPEKLIQTTGIVGTKASYHTGGKKLIHNHMWDNFWTTRLVKSLPLNEANTLSLGGLSVVGSIFALTSKWVQLGLMTIGILATLIQSVKNKPLQGFNGLANAAFIDYNNGLFNGNKIPLNLIDNDEEAPSSIFFNNSTLITSFEAKITDLFNSDEVRNSDGSYKTLSTLNIGQTTFENGENILPDGTPYLVSGKEILINSFDKYSGYIIDSFMFCGIFNGELSIEFLDSTNKVVWSGIYQSEGKWTNSLREIWTIKNTSIYNRENIYFVDPTPYPKPLPEPEIDYPAGEARSWIVSYRNTYHRWVNGNQWLSGWNTTLATINYNSNSETINNDPNGVSGGMILIEDIQSPDVFKRTYDRITIEYSYSKNNNSLELPQTITFNIADIFNNPDGVEQKIIIKKNGFWGTSGEYSWLFLPVSWYLYTDIDIEWTLKVWFDKNEKKLKFKATKTKDTSFNYVGGTNYNWDGQVWVYSGSDLQFHFNVNKINIFPKQD